METTTFSSITNGFHEENMTENLMEPNKKPKGETKYFDALDYSIFVALLVLTIIIGIYYAFFAKQKTITEYLMGGKKMALFPIAFSLVASSISAISILGMPAEIYTYGTQFALIGVVEFFVATANSLLILPVFYKLQLTTVYQYLELRYNKAVRTFLSSLGIISTVFFSPVVIYMPSLALSQVTGINLYAIASVSCAVCIFYTSLGGLKAVVWTDTFQTFSMLTGVILVTVLGTIEAGGITTVYNTNNQSGRIEIFNFDVNPLVRHTFWTIMVGNFIGWLSGSSISQAVHQRCLSLPTLTKARLALFSLATGSSIFVGFSAYTGLVAYSYYRDCDPVLSKVVKKPDQIIPYFVMEFANRIPGLPGLFLGAIFSAALSTLSTIMNAASGVILEDLIQSSRKVRMSDAKASNVLKLIVLILGILCISLVAFVDKLGTIVQTTRSITGIASGSTFGIFFCGMFLPWVTAKGVIIGAITGVSTLGFISFGSQTAIAAKRIRYTTKPLSVEGCLRSNSTLGEDNLFSSGAPFDNHIPQHDDVFWMFRISYMYYSTIGLFVMVTVAVIASYFTGFNDLSKINPDLISPICQRFLPKGIRNEPSDCETNLVNISPPGDKLVNESVNTETNEDSEGKML